MRNPTKMTLKISPRPSNFSRKLALMGLLCLQSLLLADFVHSTPLDEFKIDTESRMIVDLQGRARLFHGVNVVYKGEPYHPTIEHFDPQTSVVAQDTLFLKQHGFNLVRLGVMWPGVEPIKGHYNETYLDIMVSIVNELAAQDIYTIVDLHQDSFSRKFCGDGFPTWLVDEMTINDSCDVSLLGKIGQFFKKCVPFSSLNIPNDSQGLPELKSCKEYPFFTYWDTPNVASAFQQLYTDEPIIRRLEAYWEKVTQTFSKLPGVIGYDLINEPFAGNKWAQNEFFIPGVADEFLLQPLYQRLHEVIRSIDTKKIIFFEPVITPDELGYFGGLVFPVGFKQTPGGEPYNDRQMLNYHVYCCSSGGDVCADKTGPAVKYNQQCDRFDREVIQVRESDAKRLGVGGIITEFGACPGTAPGCLDELQRVTEGAEGNFVSWIYWQFKGFNDYVCTSGSTKEGFYNGAGVLQKEKVDTLTKPYPLAIQGLPESRSWDQGARVYNLKYRLDPKIGASTLLFTNKEDSYPQGLLLDIEAGEETRHLSVNHSGNYLSIQYSGTATSSFVVSISLTPKQQKVIFHGSPVFDSKTEVLKPQNKFTRGYLHLVKGEL